MIPPPLIQKHLLRWILALGWSVAATIVYAETLDVPLVQSGINWTTIIVAALVALPPTLVALAGLREQRATKHELNHRMTAMIEAISEVARLKGITEGVAQEKAAQSKPKEPLV